MFFLCYYVLNRTGSTDYKRMHAVGASLHSPSFTHTKTWTHAQTASPLHAQRGEVLRYKGS